MRGNIVDGRYVLGESLGSGGMGEVYLAHDEVLCRDVALKVLRNEYVGDEEFAGRFRREAQSAAGLSHPNIVQVYDAGESEDGTCYIAMEYVSGGTLKQRMEGTFEASKAAAVAAQIAGALGAAHERGVIHRDIKPQNVLVTSSGDLRVTDFGIARAASAVTSSATGTFFGTAAYISPEQAMGEPVGPASDLYSLGIVLYEMLTGELPFDADNSIAVCMKHVTEPLRPPRQLNPSIPAEMDALVVKLLAKNPADRYTDAAALISDLERVRVGLYPVLAAAAVTEPLKRAPLSAPGTAPVSRRPKTLRTLAVAVVAMVVLLGTALPGLLREGAGQEGSLPRAQGVTRTVINPPATAITRTSNTDADVPGVAPGVSPTASASPTASPFASSVAPDAASPARTPVVPEAPPPQDRTPAEAQYGGDN